MNENQITQSGDRGIEERCNNNMRNPIIKDVGRGLRMLLLLYAIIHCLAAYMYVLHLVRMIFGTAIPISIVQHFNENAFTLVYNPLNTPPCTTVTFYAYTQDPRIFQFQNRDSSK